MANCLLLPFLTVSTPKYSERQVGMVGIQRSTNGKEDKGSKPFDLGLQLSVIVQHLQLLFIFLSNKWMSFLNSIFKKSNHYLFFANFYKEWLGGGLFWNTGQDKGYELANNCLLLSSYLCIFVLLNTYRDAPSSFQKRLLTSCIKAAVRKITIACWFLL